MRRLVAAFALLVASIAGCGGPGPTPAATVTATSAPPPTASAVSSASSGSPPASLGAIAYDEALLGVLPPEIDGLAVVSTPENLADVADDADLAANAERIAFGLVIDPVAGEFANAAVVGLRDGVYNDTFFRDWRDTYDDGACAQAGGIAGHAEADLGGRTVFIGSCAGGVHTYHAYLPERDVVISITSIGETRRLGEQLIGALRA